MYIFILDANVPRDLNKVKRLDEIMSLMNNVDFKIYISSINFYEMPYEIQENIRKKHSHIVIDETDKNELSVFTKKMHKKGVILTDKDFAMLYTSHKLNATHIISSDTQVLLMTKKYAKCCDKNVEPFHLLNMFGLLHKIMLIDFKLCIKMSLSLYKNKEIPQIIEEYGDELITNKIKRSIWKENELKVEYGPIGKFGIYERHIIENLNNRYKGG